MKTINIAYWICTGLATAGMLFTSFSSLADMDNATKFFGMIGYHSYMIVFLSWAKILGVIAILVPGFPRIKEWAYAGLTFDLAVAFYSLSAVMSVVGAIPVLVFALPLIASYFLYHRRLKMKQAMAA